MLNLVGAIFGIAVVVAMAAIAAGLVYVGLNERSYAHANADPAVAD